MEITAEVVADSLAPCGARLMTQVWTINRDIQAEVNTHKMLSKSSASSRAIPPARMIQNILSDPFVPLVWGTNQAGMQAGVPLEGEAKTEAERDWLRIRDIVIKEAMFFQAKHNLHKQIVNRLVQPWMMTKIIISGTDWDNLFGLRCHPAAEPHFQKVAYAARNAMQASTPRQLKAGMWHLPFVDKAAKDDPVHGIAGEVLYKVAMARCARVSYLNHEGKFDVDSDVALFEKLVGQDPKHAAPSEHIAQALDWPKWYLDLDDRTNEVFKESGFTVRSLRESVVGRRNKRRKELKAPNQGDLYDEACLGELQSGNYLGFRQYRKTLKNENIGGLMP